MNNKTNPNDQAFSHVEGYVKQGSQKGLTKLEYFAAMAMQGMLAKYGTDYQTQHAKESVFMAYELIKALNK